MPDSSESSNWHAPCYGLKKRGCRRRREAAEAERLSRLSSDDETSEREQSREPIRHTVTASNNAPTQSLSVKGKGVRRRTRSKGSKKKNSRGKRTTNRRRR
jgi:hypothetical protein